jgi:hypothetical protein
MGDTSPHLLARTVIEDHPFEEPLLQPERSPTKTKAKVVHHFQLRSIALGIKTWAVIRFSGTLMPQLVEGSELRQGVSPPVNEYKLSDRSLFDLNSWKRAAQGA